MKRGSNSIRGRFLNFKNPIAMPRSALRATLLLCPAALLLSGCVTVPLGQSAEHGTHVTASGMHQVRDGETAESLAAQYETTPARIYSENRMAPNTKLVAGTVISIPETTISRTEIKQTGWWNPFHLGSSKQPTSSAAPVPDKALPNMIADGRVSDGSSLRSTSYGRVPSNFAAYDVTCPSGACSGRGYMWPVANGKVTRPFSETINHKGLDICAPPGTPVRAACNGKVIYEGCGMANFGNIVLIDHGGGLVTVYAHNRKNLVRNGETVKRGQVIAEVGQTGNATTPHCHFEVRKDTKPIDPRPFLP
ncbi:MAG: M23 family metallopeptidase [Candidatus Sumerlaeaceae bacterium]|nr:M23 family metallopeptidase [Candidatus Sumerlaeaceae bacterium]